MESFPVARITHACWKMSLNNELIVSACIPAPSSLFHNESRSSHTTSKHQTQDERTTKQRNEINTKHQAPSTKFENECITATKKGGDLNKECVQHSHGKPKANRKPKRTNVEEGRRDARPRRDHIRECVLCWWWEEWSGGGGKYVRLNKATTLKR